MRVEGMLRRQAGVITRQQALAAGMSVQQIDRRVAAGRWLAVHPGVYLAGNRDWTAEARSVAAGLWAGDSATVSGLAAAWWHGLCADPPPIVEVTVPVRRSPRPRPGIQVRRRDLGIADRVGIRGLWVTAVPLTVLEAAVALGAEGAQLLDRALQRRARFDALCRAHWRNFGRRGSTSTATWGRG